MQSQRLIGFREWSDAGAGRLLNVSDTIPNITIPADLLPVDGRFGSGPSKVRTEAVDALAATGTSYLGTSHRKDPVKDIVLRMQDGMRELFSLPTDWDVIIGNGGATILWDALTLRLHREPQPASFLR